MKTLLQSKFEDNPSPEFLSKNNCYDPRIPDDNHLDLDSMNTLKKDLQKFYHLINFFISRFVNFVIFFIHGISVFVTIF